MFDRIRQRLAWILLPKARYEGATHDPRRSYVPAHGGPDRFAIPSCSRQTLVKRAQYFEKNSALLNRMADLFEQYSVGQGLVIQPDSSSPEFNKAAADYFAEWSLEPDIGSNFTLEELEGIAARKFFIDGEISFLKVTDDSGAPKIQLIEADAIANPEGVMDSEGLSDGVYVDKNGKPVAYSIKGITWDRGAPMADFTKKDAGHLIRLMEPGSVGQLRGLPFSHPVLKDLIDLTDLKLLEMDAAKANAEKTEIVTLANNGPNPGAMAAAKFGMVPKTAASCGTSDAGTYYESVTRGKARIIRPGDSYAQFPGTRPSDATRTHWKLLEEQICIGIGIPAVIVSPDSMQGTVFRGALDMANAFFTARWSVMARAFSKVYAYAIEAGKFKVPALRDPPADWKKVAMYPPRAVNVDVGRNSRAELDELNAGTTNRRTIYSAQGKDWKRETDQKNAEDKYILDSRTALGLVPIEGTQPAPEPVTPETVSAAVEESLPVPTP